MKNKLKRLLLVLISTLLSAYVSIAIAASPPYSEGVQVLTLQNASQVDTVQFGLNENVTVKFTNTSQHDKVELTVWNYNQTTKYLNKVDLSETDNGDGTYTYTYTFNTDTEFSGVADWYYFEIKPKNPNGKINGYLIVGNPGTPHWIKTYSDADYTQEADSFVLSDTVYVEVVGDDNGESIKKEKAKVKDYEDDKHIDLKTLSGLTNNAGVYRFSMDLSNPKTAFTTDWWYTLEVEIEQDDADDKSFVGYKQIQILAVPSGGTKTWTQQQWREVD